MKFILLGLTNVGKSLIFNVLTNSNNLSKNQWNTTIDWIEKNNLVDTPGVKSIKEIDILLENFDTNIHLLFVVRNNISNLEVKMCTYLYNKFPLTVILNNVENDIIPSFPKIFINDNDFFPLNNLINYKEQDYSVLIIGGENSGKSSLFNSLLNYNRSIVSIKNGTTVDFVKETWQNNLILCDTPGFNNNKENNKRILKELENIKGAIILINGESGLTVMDKKIMGKKFGFWQIVCVNKKDVLTNWKELPKNAIFISCKTGEINPIIKSIRTANENSKKLFSTSQLNNWLKSQSFQLFDIRAKPCKIKFIKQISVLPTVFKYFSPFPMLKQYEKFIIKKMKEDLGLDYVNISLIWSEH